MSNDGTGLREAAVAAIERLRAPALMFDSDRRLLAGELESALSAVAPPGMTLIGEAQIRAENEALTGCTWFRSAIPPGTPIYAASPAAPAQHWERIDPTARWITHDFSDNQLPKYFCIKSAQPEGGDAVAKLQAFKDYVHQRLDDMGVPADPESPHKAAGCRVGGRLDYVEARITRPAPAQQTCPACELGQATCGYHSRNPAQQAVTDEMVREWRDRNGLNIGFADAACAIDDARSLHMLASNAAASAADAQEGK